MRRTRLVFVPALLAGGIALAVTATIAACGGGSSGSGFSGGPGDGQDGSAGPPGTTADGAVAPPTDAPLFGMNDGTAPPPDVDGGVPCPAGLECNVSCSAGGTTIVTGKVYDPAGKNPLYNVAVYVPATPLVPLPKGVQTGADACQCGALFQSGSLANTQTAVDGSFKLTNVPVGSKVPLVLQVGKWRRYLEIPVTACTDNMQADKSLTLPGTVAAGDTNDSLPDIAVSTGAYDTLECLMYRMGIPETEYVAGAGSTGHVHIFSGGKTKGSKGGTGNGAAESPPMTGAPTSWTGLWDTQADMMPYDVVLLSCEGDETYNSNPTVLEQYLNAGGRAFGSHYHYAWFAGSLESENVPAPPADWGASLATWGPNLGTIPSGAATVVQTLTGTNKPFPKGLALVQWLQVVNALGVEGAPANEIPIYDENGDVGATEKAQAWLADNGYTDYLSFDTPVDAPASADGGAPAYCGRAVFSDLHLNSDPASAASGDSNPPPTGCKAGDLSPQEKALEFMLFDLSSCVIPDTVPPETDAGLPVIH